MKNFLATIALAAMAILPAAAQNSPAAALQQSMLGSGVFRISTAQTNPPADYNPWRTIGPNGFTMGFVLGATNADCLTNIVVVYEFSDDKVNVITTPSGAANFQIPVPVNGTNLAAFSTNLLNSSILASRNYIRVKTIDNTNMVGTAGSVYLTNAYILSK